MDFIKTLAELEAHYGKPGQASLVKVARQMTPIYRAWIMKSRLCILTTVGPEGTDGSPRGDDGPVVRELDPGTLAMPDWRGNDRIDSLRNIVSDGRVSLLFIVAGSNNVVRINGRAKVSADKTLCDSFTRDGKAPRCVIVIAIDEIYSQCARALMRARIWVDGDQSGGLPSVGDMLAEMTNGGIDGTAYDREWPGRATQTLW